MENNNMPPQQNTPIPPTPPFNTPPVPPFVAPPPRRKKWPFIVGGIVVLLGVAFLAMSLLSSTPPSTSDDQAMTGTVSNPDETQYLIFNIGAYGDPSVPKNGVQIYGEAVY